MNRSVSFVFHSGSAKTQREIKGLFLKYLWIWFLIHVSHLGAVWVTWWKRHICKFREHLPASVLGRLQWLSLLPLEKDAAPNRPCWDQPTPATAHSDPDAAWPVAAELNPGHADTFLLCYLYFYFSPNSHVSLKDIQGVACYQHPPQGLWNPLS